MLRKLKQKIPNGQEREQKNAPKFVDERLMPQLANAIFDWQITHGVMLKYRDGDLIKAKPVAVSLVPTPFPKHLFEHAQKLQKAYNELYAKVSSDEEWLLGILGKIAKEDEFINTLLELQITLNSEELAQNLTLGIFRSDYMLHQDEGLESDHKKILCIKQVEMNTISCAGGCHANRAAEMHEFMAGTGAFQQYDPSIGISSLPHCNTISSNVSALASAHAAYGPPKCPQADETAILMIVQPFNYNIADERPIEYGLWASNPSVPCYRCIFRPEVLINTSLTENRELLYHPPHREGLPPVEISVVYFRAACHDHEYDRQGRAARLHLERSRAIKCPDILAQLAGSKIVQQQLSQPEVLSKFIQDQHDRQATESSFGRMWPLDDTALGKQGRAIALDPAKAIRYVLKPNRDGGRNNIYRADISPFLKARPESTWVNYILMELFEPPTQEGKLMTGTGIYEGEVVSELGIFGTCLWQRSGEVVENNGATGWSFKTKPVHVDEMSVVKGYGCFDCPRLSDE